MFTIYSGAQYTSTVRTFFRFQTTWCACMVQCNAVQCNPWTVFYKSYNRSTTFVRYTHSIICKHQIFFKRKRIRNSSRVIYLLNTHFHPPKNTQTFAKNANTKNYFYKKDTIPCFLFFLLIPSRILFLHSFVHSAAIVCPEGVSAHFNYSVRRVVSFCLLLLLLIFTCYYYCCCHY